MRFIKCPRERQGNIDIKKKESLLNYPENTRLASNKVKYSNRQIAKNNRKIWFSI
jgi:hypothetical protein